MAWDKEPQGKAFCRPGLGGWPHCPMLQCRVSVFPPVCRLSAGVALVSGSTETSSGAGPWCMPASELQGMRNSAP